MLVPLSWLKEYVDVKMPFEKLAARMSEVGLTIETWRKDGEDIIFDPEITPNRPDWMSVTGIAREIAAATGSKLKIPDIKVDVKKIKNPLSINIKPNYVIVPRVTSVIIKDVKVKPSPLWMQSRIKQIGLRPINNLVDITNYVLWLYGGLLHVFDYDKIRGHQMVIDQAKGGENFRSLDGIDYKLPKDAIIIKDVGRVIDLLPLKGGETTAASDNTKTVLLHSIICDPILTRRTSQALGLRSDSSAIAERGLDPNSTVKAVHHALLLILELAGGEVASEIMDHKEHEFLPWEITVSHEKIERVLGIQIEKTKVKNIFESLGITTGFHPATGRGGTLYEVTIPTYRNDLHIEEDLIEEAGRIYGYNNFPKSLPASSVPTEKAAYTHDFDFDYSLKQILKGLGYNEIYTYSLISRVQLKKLGIDPNKNLRITNPISNEYEYLRPTLLGNLLDAYKLNQPNFEKIKLFEFGKVYQGENIDKFTERYQIGAIVSGQNFFETKGEIELLLNNLGINTEFVEDTNPWFHPSRCAAIMVSKERVGMLAEINPKLVPKALYWELNPQLLEKYGIKQKTYQPISKYPPLIEDVTLDLPEKTAVGNVIKKIGEQKYVTEVKLIDVHQNSYTFRISFHDPLKPISSMEIKPVREKIQNINYRS